MKNVLTLRKRIYLKNKKLQNPKTISIHLKQLKGTYLKNSNPILLETINYWENKLEDKLTQINLIK